MRFSLFLLFLFSACTPPGSSKTCPRDSQAASLLRAAETQADASMNATAKEDQVRFAKLGLSYAEDCVRRYPQEAGCYFYRAVNRGLYLKAVPFQYQKKLNLMVADAEKSLQLNPAFDHGGAYRMLGTIYLKAPSFSLKKVSVTKDIDKSWAHAQKALEVDSGHRGNRWLMAQVLAERDEWREAEDYLEALIVDFRAQSLSVSEREDQKEAEKLLHKARKKLTKG